MLSGPQQDFLNESLVLLFPSTLKIPDKRNFRAGGCASETVASIVGRVGAFQPGREFSQ